MAYIVENATGQHWLKGSIWSYERDRATIYPTPEAATAALANAAKFNKRGAKDARIVEVIG
jgi:hypothetical protein